MARSIFKNARIPLILGPMYPCSNVELVGSAAASGIVSIFQPLSLTFAHGHDFEEGVKEMQRRAGDQSDLLGMNALIEKSSKRYMKRQEEWVDHALSLGVKIFITSLGNPNWVVKRAEKHDALVYHDVVDARWARKAANAGVHGLIAVNKRAGGHAGALSAQQLLDDLEQFKLPLVCAGGVGDGSDFVSAMSLRGSKNTSHGYAGVQCGTRFIASRECSASDAYKEAIMTASEDDVTLTKKLTGVDVSIIRRPGESVDSLKISPILSFFLSNPRLKHIARTYLALSSFRKLKSDSVSQDFKSLWQAGKSAGQINSILSCEEIVSQFEQEFSRK